MAGRGTGRLSPNPVGRGRGRGGRSQPQQERSPGATGRLSSEPTTGEPLSIAVDLSSLTSGITTGDLTFYFETLVPDAKVSSPVMLGDGRARLVLEGITTESLQQLNTRKHKIRSQPVTAEFKPYSKADQEPPPLDFDEEEGPTMIKVKNAPDVSEEALKTFFEGSRGGGCAGAVANVTKISSGVFHVTFHDPKVAAQVVSETRTFKKMALQLSFVKEVSKPEPSEADDPNEIEVSNVPEAVTEGAVQTYFEGTRSGGCAKAVAKCKKISSGVFHVTFHDSKVAAQVMKKESHKLKRAILQLRFVRQKKHSVQQYKPNQLAMYGLPEGVGKDILEVVIADRLDMEEEDDFDVEISGQSSIITFVKDYTIDELQQMKTALSSEPVKEVPVTVELCEALKPSIHIRNITTTQCDEEFLKFYFSNPKRSGGGEVESIEILSDKEAIVTFSDPAVIPSVLGRQHPMLGGTALLHEVGADTPPPLAQSPTSSPHMKPLEVPIDPLFAQSLSRSPIGLEQSIMESNVMFSADEKAGMVVFSPTRQSKPNWQEKCQEKLSSYVDSRLIKEEIVVPKEAAAQTMSAVVKLEKKNPSLIVIPNKDGTVITVAGELSSVSKAKESIKKICSALITDTVSVVLSPEDFDFVQQMKMSDFPANIECTFVPSTFKILLKGPIGDVSQFKESIENFVQHADIPVMLDPLVTQFFSTENGKGKLEMFLQERQCRAALHFNPHPNLTLHLLCKKEDANSVRAVMHALPLAVIAQAIPVPDTVAPILPDLEEFKQLCQEVEKDHCVLIKHVGREISAAGFKTEVTSGLTEIDQFLKEKASPLPPAEMRVGPLTAKVLHNSQRGIEKQLQPFHVQLQIDVAGGVVQFSPMHYLKPGWEESCKSSVLAYIQANVAEVRIQVPQNAYSDVMTVLYASQQDDSTFTFNYPPNSTALAYAGDKRTVKSTEDKIAQLCANYSYKSEELVLDPEDFEFLCHLKMQDLIVKYRGNVEIEPQHETHTLALSGPVKGVKAVKEYVQSQTAHATVPVTLEPAVVKYFATDEGKARLFVFLREKRCDKFATYISESPMKLCLLCATKHKKITETAAMALQENTCVAPLQIPDLLLPFLPELPDFIKEVKSLGKENSVQISIEGKQILIAGFQDGVSTSIDSLSAFVKQKVVHFQPIRVPVDPLIAKCIVENPVGFHACMAKIQVKCNIKTEQSSATAYLSPTKAAKSGWKEESQSELTSYIKANYSREEVEVPKPAAGEVFQLLMTKQKHNVFQFELCNDGSHAIVAGEKNVVQEVQTNISEICNKHQTTETMQLSAREYDFFTQVVQPQLQTGVSIEHIPAKHCIVIGGSISEVKDMENSMKGMIQHGVVPVAVEAMLVEFFTTDGKQDLASYVQNKGLQAALHSKLSVYPPTLEFLCDPKLEPSLRDLARKIPEETQVSVMSLPESLTTTPITQEFAEHCKELETQFRVAIKTNQNELRICGFRNPVIDVKKSLESFINKKCSTKKSFPIPTGMWRLFSGPMKPRWMKIELQCQGSKVELPAPVKEEGKFAILLKGDKVEVQKICQSITQLIQSVATAAIPVSRPGLIKYFSEGEKGRMMIPGIESAHKVCIEVVDVGEEMEMEQTATRSITYGGAPRFVKECVAEVVNMKQISIYTGDITEFRADVIVNAANEDLKHVGGLADAILKKGGQVIQQESNRYVRTNGPLRAGQVWLSSTVGSLPCLALIHAVGPRWYNNPSNRQQLQKVCMSCFKEAKVYGSIALPAISSGVFGCPIDQCADILIATAVNFCKNPRSGNLQEINFVLFKKTDAPFFIKALQDQLPPQNIRRRSESSAWESSLGASYGTPTYVASSAMPYNASDGEESYEEVEENEPLIQSSVSPLNRVLVQQGSILDVEAEIYVNSTNGNMDLSGGAVAQALAKAAGPSLQAECNKKAPIAAGEIAVTGPGNILRCKHILHINCPQYDQSGGQAEDMLRTIIHKCMKECDKRGASTIVFPAIGTGNLGFPQEVAAHIMVDEVYNYLKKNTCKSLSMVYFIIYMENMYRSFCEEVEKRKQHPGPAPQPRKVKKSMKPSKSTPQNQRHGGPRDEYHGPPPQQKYRGQRDWSSESSEPTGVTKQGDLGNHLTVEVLKGDITKEKTDAIVNPTNREMRLEGRGVAGALLKKAGQELQKACDEVRARGEYLSEGKVIDTRPGKLKCKRVFHIIFESNNKTTFIKVIRSCIERAIQLKFTSIAFPAIGTGMQGFPAAEAAKGMMSALQQCHSPSALSVRIVLFQDDVCSAFKMTFDDQVGDRSGWLQKIGRAVWSIVPSMPSMPSMPSVSSWFSPDPLAEEEEEEEEKKKEEETENEIELRIYGETEENVKSAEDSLDKLINMQFKTEDYEDDKIAMLSRMQEKILRDEARRLQIVFDIDRALKYIQLKGSKESISEMKVKIVEILNQVEKEANRKQQAETMMKVVQWKRMDSLQTPYDPLTNLEIEEALRAEKPSYVFRHPQSAESFTIDFKKMEEIDHAMNDQTCRVKRIAEGAESDSGLPDDWEPMIDPKSGKEVTLRVIDLPATSKGYQFVLAEFHKTMPQGNYSTIVKIERIQNPALYGQYIAKKKQLDTHNPKSVQNERWLFHGTTSAAVPQINQTNFNRSFRGQNGTVYGQGTYFARDASYSNRYASTDANGLKHMYVVRVLTGEYTTGSNSMIVAPPKDPSDDTVLFDSVVDNLSNPAIYVVFYDADAYPEYLIVYK